MRLKLNKIKAYHIIKSDFGYTNHLAVNILEDIIEIYQLEYEANNNLLLKSSLKEGFITNRNYFVAKFGSSLEQNKFALSLLKKHGFIDKKIAYKKPYGGSVMCIILNLINIKDFLVI
jgi:hypothetical protein